MFDLFVSKRHSRLVELQNAGGETHRYRYSHRLIFASSFSHKIYSWSYPGGHKVEGYFDTPTTHTHNTETCDSRRCTRRRNDGRGRGSCKRRRSTGDAAHVFGAREGAPARSRRWESGRTPEGVAFVRGRHDIVIRSSFVVLNSCSFLY